MSGAQWGFNARNYDPTQSDRALPVGKHPVIITGSEVKGTRGRTGGMLSFKVQIIDGAAKGQTGAYNLNLWNQNEQAAEIAHRQLSAICHVIGVYDLQGKPEGVELFNKPFIINVVPQTSEEAKEKGYTQIDSVYSINGEAPKPVAAQQMQGQGSPTFAQQPAPQQQPAQQAPAWQQPAPQAQPQMAAPAWQAPAQAQPAPQQQPAWQQQPAGGAPSWQR